MQFEQTRVHRVVHEILQRHPDAWDELFQLQQDVERLPPIVLVDIITTIVLKHDCLEDHDTSEVPKLLNYFSEFVPPCNKGPIMNEVLNYISYAKHSDIAELVELMNVLKDNCSKYLPIFYDRLGSNDEDIAIESRRNEFCSTLVTTLTKFKFPSDATEITKTRELVNQVEMFLKFLVDDKNYTRKKHLKVICLETLYSIISDVSNVQSQERTIALVVLRLVDEPEQFFGNYFVSTDHDDASLARALKVLCLNLLSWPGDKINVWVLCLIKHFEHQQKYTILNEFAEEVLPKIFISLNLSAIRTTCSPVIFYILKKQASPKLLNSLKDNIHAACITLNNSPDEGARDCLQNLVDIVGALVRRFPENEMNRQFLARLVVPNSSAMYDIVNEEVWEIKISEMIDYPIPVRSNIDKVGLTNLGNTCYMNSVLQALLTTKQFCYEVLAKDPVCEGGENSVLKKLRNLFALLMYSNRNSWAPTEILQACRPAYFLPGQQQDSSEFLCHLLDVLHEQEKIMPLQYPSCSTTSNELKMEDKDCEITPVSECEPMESVSGIKRWTTEENLSEGGVLQRKTQSLADVTNGEDLTQTQNLSDSHSDSTDSGIQSVDGEDTSQNSLVHRVFGGRSNITYQCTQCNNSSHNTDKFRDLQLCFPEEISENQAVKVQDLINYYFLPENLTGDNKYRCDKCTKLCDAQRTIQILQAPSHLILTLKHFRYDSETRLRTKLRHKVIYNEVIKLEVSTPSEGEIPEEYYLYAAVVHSGHSMDYGHYFTYARGSKNDWYKFNDSYVSQTSFQEFERLEPPDTPYILFYAKVNGNEMFEDEKPELITLSKSVQDLVNEDTAKYKEEMKHQSEKKGRCAKLSTPKLCEDNNPDDDNPPSSSCRDFMNMPNNRCQY